MLQQQATRSKPPKWTLGTNEVGIAKKLVGLEDHIVNILIKQVYTYRIREICDKICHSTSRTSSSSTGLQ